MPRTKKTEKALPKMGEIVSINDARARRDAKRADVFCGASVIYGEAREGDTVLCELKTGGYIFAFCESAAAADSYAIRSGRLGEIKHVVGRVVSVQLQTESDGAAS